MFTVIDYECWRFLRDEMTLEQIQEYAEKHQSMMEGFSPSSMQHVQARAINYERHMKS